MNNNNNNNNNNKPLIYTHQIIFQLTYLDTHNRY